MDVIYLTLRWAVSGLYGGGDRPNITTRAKHEPVVEEVLQQQEIELDIIEGSSDEPRIPLGVPLIVPSPLPPRTRSLAIAEEYVAVPPAPASLTDQGELKPQAPRPPSPRRVECDTPVVIPAATTPRNQEVLQARNQQSLENVENAAATILHSDAEEEFDFDLVERPDENLGAQGALDTRWNRMHRYLFDPANPEKKKKYLYAMHTIKKGLPDDFETKGLPALREAFNPNSEDFIYHAYLALKATSEIGREQEIKGRYIFIVEHLRAALAFAPSASDSERIQSTRALLYHLCYLKFSAVHMYPFLEDFVSKALHAPQEFLANYEIPNLSFETVADAIEEANHRLRTAPPIYLQRGIAKDWKKVQGTIGFWGFDPTFDSNTPWVHSIQRVQTAQGEKEILILRHGTPTRDVNPLHAAMNGLRTVLGYAPSSDLATIVPEFIGYIKAHPEKQILYVNHQAYAHHLQNPGPGEYARSRVIRGLEDEHENFHFLSLPFDGELFKSSILNELSTGELINQLQHNLVHQTNGFGWPKQLPIASLEQDLPHLLNQVHDLYFNRKELQTIEEKKAFIMLFYSELKDYVKDKLNIDLMTSACKDNKDRGNASTLVDMAKNVFKLGQNDSPKALRELFFSALAPFIIKNEEIIEERLELALHVIRHLASLPEEQKQKVQQANERARFKVLSQSVPKEELSPSQMMGPESFVALREHLRNTQEQRMVEDPNFVSAFQEKEWTRESLRAQIQRDLPHMDLWINGQRALQWEELQEVPLELLPFLTLEAAQLTREDPAQYLNGNALGSFVSLAPGTFQPQIHLTLQNGHYDLQIQQDLVLGDHPIQSKVLLKTGRRPQVAWNFVRFT